MQSSTKVSGGATGSSGWLLLQMLTVLGLAAALGSCTPLRIQFPVQQTDPDWTNDGRSATRNRVALDLPVTLPIQEAWRYNAGAGFGAGSPLIVGDNVFLATRKGELHVVELATGDKVGTEAFGQSIEGSPAFQGHTIFVPNAWGKNALTAFDLFQGIKPWEYRGVPIEASLLAIGGLVIAGDVEGKIIAFAQSNGKIQWKYDFPEVTAILSGPTRVGDDHVVVANEDGGLVCLSIANGEVLWKVDSTEPVEASLASDESHVYVPTTRGVFKAIDWRTGQISWEYRLEDETVRFAGAGVADGMVIFGGTDGHLRAVDVATGTDLWTFQTDGAIAAPPAISGRLVFVGAMDRQFFAIGLTDGSVQWSTTLKGRVKSAPAVRKGWVVVASEPKYVYAFANAASIPDS